MPNGSSERSAPSLDRVLLLGKRHLRSVLKTYVEHYNCKRPYSGLSLVAPKGTNEVPPFTIDDSVKRPISWVA